MSPLVAALLAMTAAAAPGIPTHDQIEFCWREPDRQADCERLAAEDCPALGARGEPLPEAWCLFRRARMRAALGRTAQAQGDRGRVGRLCGEARAAAAGDPAAIERVRASCASLLEGLVDEALQRQGRAEESAEIAANFGRVEAPDPVAEKDAVTGMSFVRVPGGCFQMGDGPEGLSEDEGPAHEVCVRDFLIGKYEVTRDQWQKIMGRHPLPADGCGDDCPADDVSWDQAQDYIKRLNENTGRRERWPGVDDEAELGSYVWYEKNSGKTLHPVGQKVSNSLGLHDMGGNAWEWVGDRYDGVYYRVSSRNDPQGPERGERRVLRGGSWESFAWNTRTTYRRDCLPYFGNLILYGSTGFRLVLPQ